MASRVLQVVVAAASEVTATQRRCQLPVLTSDELVSAQQWAAAHGALLNVERDWTADEAALGTGLVAYLDASAEPSAQAWGAALDRDVVALRGLADLGHLGGSSVTVVLPTGTATYSLFNELADIGLRRDVAIGVVRADGKAARRHRLLSALRHGCRVAVHSEFVGAPLDVESMGAFDTLFVQTHGNGVDMPLSGRVVCARRDYSGPPHAHSLPCFDGGACLRLPTPTEDPTRFIRPEQLSADAVVLDACWGVVPDDGVYHPDTTIGGRILTGPWTTSLLATYRIQATSLTRFDQTVRDYLSGRSLGELVVMLNLTADMPAWVLWGDPERRMPSDTQIVRVMTSPSRRAGTTDEAGEMYRARNRAFQALLLRHCAVARNEHAELAARLNAAALQQVSAIGSQRVMPSTESSWPTPGEDARSALDRDLSARACIWPSAAVCEVPAQWLSTSFIGAPRLQECPRCSAPTTRSRRVSELFRIVRVTIICPRCGVLVDVPASWREAASGFVVIDGRRGVVSGTRTGWWSASTGCGTVTAYGTALVPDSPLKANRWLTVALADHGDFGIQRIFPHRSALHD